MVEYVRYWSQRADIGQGRLLGWLGVWSSTFSHWKRRLGQAFPHNGQIPREHWLQDWEKQAIVKFHFDHPLEGYRRLAYMMLDANVVACSPASVYRVLGAAGLLQQRTGQPSKKGTGFEQPLRPHEHWHVDIAVLNLGGTMYFLTTILDGYSRLIVGWDVGTTMKEEEVELVVQRAREQFPDAKPRIISDNGPQFLAKDFKAYVRLCGMTHVRTSPYYPQSNGKIERYHRTLKSDCIRPGTPLTRDDAQRIIDRFVREYNETRLHSAIGYITPRDMIEGRQATIFEERQRKLAEARSQRQLARSRAPSASYTPNSRPEDRALLGSNPSAESIPVTEMPIGCS